MPKLRYGLVEFCGDYYYQEVSIDEIIQNSFDEIPDELQLSTLEDISNFAQDNVGQKMPLSGPLWKLYFQEEYVEDG